MGLRSVCLVAAASDTVKLAQTRRLVLHAWLVFQLSSKANAFVIPPLIGIGTIIKSNACAMTMSYLLLKSAKLALISYLAAIPAIIFLLMEELTLT